MTEKLPHNQSEFEHLSDEATVYRALLRQQWIDEDTGKVKRDAYYLRQDRGETGLSVRIASVCTPEECAAKFRSCYGVASLNVGYIRSLGLEVIPDSPSHANIIGLPYREDNRLEADRFARLLARESRIVWP